MIVERLGQYRSVDSIRRDAYVVWLDNPTQGIGPQMPLNFECESCQNMMDNHRFKNMGVLQTPAIRQISVVCSVCGTVYHYDITPESDRASLGWIHTFLK